MLASVMTRVRKSGPTNAQQVVYLTGTSGAKDLLLTQPKHPRPVPPRNPAMRLEVNNEDELCFQPTIQARTRWAMCRQKNGLATAALHEMLAHSPTPHILRDSANGGGRRAGRLSRRHPR